MASQALSGLGSLYAHPYTTVLRVTKMPDDYPDAYSLPKGANVGPYADSGWCFTESSWASLTKDSSRSLDLGCLSDAVPPTESGVVENKATVIAVCTQGGGRQPPLLPDQFDNFVAKKLFTNGKDDRPLVAKLYRAAFAAKCGQVRELSYRSLSWNDAEAEQLANVLHCGAFSQLVKLDVDGNLIGDAGFAAIAQAIYAGALPQLQTVFVQGNPGNSDAVYLRSSKWGIQGSLQCSTVQWVCAQPQAGRGALYV